MLCVVVVVVYRRGPTVWPKLGLRACATTLPCAGFLTAWCLPDLLGRVPVPWPLSLSSILCGCHRHLFSRKGVGVSVAKATVHGHTWPPRLPAKVLFSSLGSQAQDHRLGHEYAELVRNSAGAGLAGRVHAPVCRALGLSLSTA